MMHPAPPGPLMVRYSSPLVARNNIGDALKMINEGKVLKLGCLILAKDRPEVISDDEKLDDTKSDYLVALREDFLPIHRLFMWSPTAPIGAIDSLTFVSESSGYF